MDGTPGRFSTILAHRDGKIQFHFLITHIINTGKVFLENPSALPDGTEVDVRPAKKRRKTAGHVRECRSLSLRIAELAETQLGRIFVTEYVLVELGSALTRGSDRQVFLTTLELIETEGNTTIVPASTKLFRQSLGLHARRPDKDWSLVDWLSLVVMKKPRLPEALTADHHFVQAGLTTLLA